MICPSCGYKNPNDNAPFCGGCGRPLRIAAANAENGLAHRDQVLGKAPDGPGVLKKTAAVAALIVTIAFARLVIAYRSRADVASQAGPTLAATNGSANAAAPPAGSLQPESTLSPTLQPAEFTKDGAPSGRELTIGDYQIKPGSSPVGASNTTVSLTVREFRIVPTLGDQQPTPRHAFLVVSADWKNTGPIPYMVPGVPDHLFLLIQRHSPATVSDATKAAPHPLPTDSLTIPAGNNLSGNG